MTRKKTKGPHRKRRERGRMTECAHYGMVGWREFHQNRRDILSKYDSARAKVASRPVKTHHGVVGEAAFREWLANFLPAKYGVTSGYIIPDVVQTDEYDMYHYDVVIFDHMNAPILWLDEDPDRADRGKSRAIPARYVRSVMELKAAFQVATAQEALKKLAELNRLAPHLPQDFSSFPVFFELPDEMIARGDALKYLLPAEPVFGLRGGLLLRCSLNADMSATMMWTSMNEPGSVNGASELPLARDVESLDIYLNSDGQAIIAEGGAGATFTAEYVPNGVSRWHVSKMYSPCYSESGTSVHLSWSFNAFSHFALDLLAWLEGTNPRDAKYRFAQIFDHLERR